jgi:hypothetical protein
VTDKHEQSPPGDLPGYVPRSIATVERKEPARVLAYDPGVGCNEADHGSIALGHDTAGYA